MNWSRSLRGRDELAKSDFGEAVRTELRIESFESLNHSQSQSGNDSMIR